MKSKITMVSLVAAVFALAMISIASVSAFGSITSIEVNGVESVSSIPTNVASFAGQTLPVRVIFKATDNATDVRVKVWITGERAYAVSSERFDVLAGSVYSSTVAIQMPFNIDPKENFNLEVSVESRHNGVADEKTVRLAGQRESYLVEILDVNMDSNVQAGDRLALDIVLKNRGRQPAVDTFVKVTIPALGVEERAYFGDLSPVDQANPDKQDSAERRMFLNIPSTAKPGVYDVQLEAFNGDSSTTLSKKIAVGGVGEDSSVVSAASSKSFATGETGSYSLTLVNSGNKVRIYQLSVDASDNLNVDVSDQVIVVPAGSSRTVKMDATASKAGKYMFTVSVTSDGELVKKQSYTANVEGSNLVAGGSNTTVLLTVVLAIIFVVLLVVLIVLLTRKPEKKEFGESYY